MKILIDLFKNALASLNSRTDQAKEQICELEERLFEKTQRRQKKKSSEANLKDFKNNLIKANIRVIGLQEEIDKKIGVEIVFKELLTENYPNLEKDINIPVQKGCRPPSRYKLKKTT